MAKKLYLANPYGFSEQQKNCILPLIVKQLERLGAEVWEPFDRNNQVDLSETGWAYKIALVQAGRNNPLGKKRRSHQIK
jgi:nucleoside 2-deoxyribosyltransferase